MDMAFCHGCGKEIHKTAPGCPGCGAPQQISKAAHAGASEKPFMQWYGDVFKKYATFAGRAERKEFWYFTLINALVVVALAIVDNLLGLSATLQNLYTLAVFLPSIAVAARRMHDTGRSGWWQLLPIVNIVFFAQEGNAGSNKYGDDPKAL